MFGKNKEDSKGTKSIGILEQLKSLPPEELEELRKFLKGDGVYDEKAKEAEEKEIEAEPTEGNLEKDINEEKDIGEVESTNPEVSKVEAHEEVEGEEAIKEEVEGKDYEPMEETNEEIGVEEPQEDENAEISDTPLTEKEEALLAENAALKEENEQLREELKKTALDTPSYKPAGIRAEQTAIQRPSPYEEQAKKYFK